MDVFKVLQRESRFFYLFVILLGAVNSIVYSGLLIFINHAILQKPVFPGYDWMIFAGLIVVSFVGTKVFQTYMVKLTQEILFDYELSVLQKLRLATYQVFEKLGAEKVYTAINDVRILGFLPEVLVAFINSIVIILCGLGYLFYAAPLGGLAVLALMNVLLVFYLVRNKQIEKDLNQVRDLQNDYHVYLRDLLYGFKEIKMSLIRNESLYNFFLKENRLTGKKLGVKSAVKFLDNELTGTYSWYVALGMVIFVLPRLLRLDAGESVPFVVIILYLMGPLASLVKILPYYTNVKIAMERIKAVETEIDQQTPALFHSGHANPFGKEFTSLVFKEVTFEYFDERMQKTFRVGPLNLEITPGELIFITGGNGSGKSTFINLLTGLYRPTGGKVYINDILLTEENYPQYSSQISAIFTSGYLFHENYEGFNLSPSNPEFADLVELMRLSGVLKIKEEKNFINTGLSKGQQKRLALIYAMLEKRQILVLDEWAAEQDPAFRAYFYEELLPLLKGSGKTIIAVTHDDHYFTQADRLLRFDYGKIAEDVRIPEKPQEALTT